jgi:hypothetical protein
MAKQKSSVLKCKPIPSVAEITKRYRYDAQSGLFYWRSDPEIIACNIRQGGAGYRTLYFPKPVRDIAAHRVVWKLITGNDPQGVVDHINGIRDDNRPDNLRDVTPAENSLGKRIGFWVARRRREAEIKRQKADEVKRKIKSRRERKRLQRGSAFCGLLSFGG